MPVVAATTLLLLAMRVQAPLSTAASMRNIFPMPSIPDLERAVATKILAFELEPHVGHRDLRTTEFVSKYVRESALRDTVDPIDRVFDGLREAV